MRSLTPYPGPCSGTCPGAQPSSAWCRWGKKGSPARTHRQGAERMEGWTYCCSASQQPDPKLKAWRVTQETVTLHEKMKHQWRKRC